MTILVTTPRGKVGSELVRLLQAQGAPLRLGAHSVAVTRGVFPGLEVVPLDYDDAASIEAAVRGVRAVYLASPGDFPAEPEQRLVDAAKRAGATQLVKLSAFGADREDTPLRHVERHVEASGLAWTILRPNWFFQNFSTSQADAIRGGTITEPAGEGKTSFLDTRDIAAVAALALTTSKHDGRAYSLTGAEALDRHEVAAVFARELDRPVAYVSPSDEQFRAALRDVLPPGYIDLLSRLYADVRAGATAPVTDDVERLLGRPPISLAQFVRDHRPVWR
ncbi:MAG TPA: SDR family oxidoreductase [Polyangiaceae bacterium]|nr:SDR family oxidoreductase [Polyangiaceae bacterium]